MKRTLFIILLSLIMFDYAYSQPSGLEKFNANRNQINTYAMLTLGGWALGNMAVNGALYRSGEKDRKYLYEMNIAWNAVNLAIAGFGLYGALNPEQGLTLFESIQQQSGIEKILLFNAGLDVGYMMTGAYLMERSKNSVKHEHRLKGYGKSLILQGGFLFAFDLVVYFIHTGNHQLMKSLLEHVALSGNGIGVTFTF